MLLLHRRSEVDGTETVMCTSGAEEVAVFWSVGRLGCCSRKGWLLLEGLKTMDVFDNEFIVGRDYRKYCRWTKIVAGRWYIYSSYV